jgi:hypothetical protein
MWETHAAPLLGERPQEVINKQIVRECDLLVATFWTRLGSPTGEAESGTTEEINWFASQRKPAMVYFSTQNIPSDADLDQVKRLREFKKSILSRGLIFDYDNTLNLESILFRQLTTVVDSMTGSPAVNIAKLKKASEQAESEEIAANESRQTSPVELLDYSEKSFVVVGNVGKHKDTLRNWNGKWMRARDGRTVMMFAKKSNLDRVSKLLKLPSKLKPYPD